MGALEGNNKGIIMCFIAYGRIWTNGPRSRCQQNKRRYCSSKFGVAMFVNPYMYVCVCVCVVVGALA